MLKLSLASFSPSSLALIQLQMGDTPGTSRCSSRRSGARLTDISILLNPSRVWPSYHRSSRGIPSVGYSECLSLSSRVCSSNCVMF
ncbi:hypothetical protein F4604DRAFT_1795115 [Suillus subluteus]|nr:hypothetical protein F4604DRAFT_1795115 [Suillus subluteus]